MKRILSVGILAFCLILIASCANKSSLYPHTNLIEESWPGAVESNPNKWTQGASSWFLNGDPDVLEKQYKDAPLSLALSTMMVDAPNFTKIKVEGPFQVQVFGSYEGNSVYLFGPNEGIRQAAVEVQGDTLCIRAAENAKNTAAMEQVVIRIGVVKLDTMVASGTGRIEGRQLRSDGLVLKSEGKNNFYLAGDIDVKEIWHAGQGCINLFNIDSRALVINTSGSGALNVNGNVGLRSITHHGTGDINIIGAGGDGFKVYADGSGKIGLLGRSMHLLEVDAKGNTCVYGYYVESNTLNVCTAGAASVGLAGRAETLHVDSSGKSRFEGKYLQSRVAYVRASQSAHINVSASQRLSAAAEGNSSIYYFGQPDELAKFVKGNAVIMPIAAPQPRRVYKDAVVKTSSHHKVKKVKTAKHTKHAKPAPKKHRRTRTYKQ